MPSKTLSACGGAQIHCLLQICVTAKATGGASRPSSAQPCSFLVVTILDWHPNALRPLQHRCKCRAHTDASKSVLRSQTEHQTTESDREVFNMEENPEVGLLRWVTCASEFRSLTSFVPIYLLVLPDSEAGRYELSN